MQYTAFDSHRRYTRARVETPDVRLVAEARGNHSRGALRRFLERFERGSPVDYRLRLGRKPFSIPPPPADGGRSRLTLRALSEMSQW